MVAPFRAFASGRDSTPGLADIETAEDAWRDVDTHFSLLLPGYRELFVPDVTRHVEVTSDHVGGHYTHSPLWQRFDRLAGKLARGAPGPLFRLHLLF